MNILIHFRVKVKKILLEAFAKKKALDRLSHIRHTSTVFTVLILEHILVFGLDTFAVSCSRVELWKEEWKKCERERP